MFSGDQGAVVGPFVVGGASVFIDVCGVGAVEDPVSVSMVVTWGVPSLCSGLAAAVAAAVVRIYMARRRA